MTLRTWAAYALTASLTLAGVVPLTAVSTSKFAAWTWKGWSDSLIPLHHSIRDPRQDRQNTTKNETPADIAAFASNYKGHLYVVDDEPDLRCVTPAAYAARYRSIVTAVLAVDPTARFSPGGLAGTGSCGGSSVYGTTYAAQFRTEYNNTYGSLPPVAEWRFHQFLDPANIAGFKAWANATATWAVNNGAPLYIGSTGFHHISPLVDVRPQLREVLDFVNADARIIGAAFWAYDIYEDENHTPHYHTMAEPPYFNNPRELSIDGLQMAAYTTSLVSGQRSGLVELGDFTGDGLADFADHQISGRRFWVHENVAGLFSTSNWTIGDLLPGMVPTVPSDWDVLVADFTGDGKADFADVHVPSGQVWVHRNLGMGAGFETASWAWAQGQPGADSELLAGDFNGDGKADLIEHQLSTGLLWVRINDGVGGFDPKGMSVGRTAVGPGWKTVIADFTGDNRVDYADLHVPSNKFWVHPNVDWTWPTANDHIRVFNSGHIAEATITASAGWETLFGDFNGDGFADYADRALGSGTFYVHLNLNNGTFSPLDWTVGQSVAGADWNVLGSR